MQLSTVIVIGLGSFLGGIARYLISYMLQGREPLYFPWGTLAVNLAGSFCIGLAYSYAQSMAWNAELRLFIIAGLLGGFTTFSALSIETLGMLQRGQVLAGLGYASGSVILGLLMAWAGVEIGELR